ncbi:MAG: cell division protein FtsA [Patescibacteria group bacterium]
MSQKITAGIDIGTHQVRVVVAQNESGAAGQNLLPKILGGGSAESKGLRHGYIINTAECVKSIEAALAQAEKSSGQKIKRAYLSVGGIGLGSVVSNGQTIVSRGDQSITELDMDLAIQTAEEAIPQAIIQNRKIIYTIPISWKIDGKTVLGRTLGLKGLKLEVKALFVTCLESHVNDLLEAVEEAGIDVIDVVASPIAASFVTLSKPQKIAGCVLVNIGAETLSIVVFENNIPISIEVFPIGSADITNDIALGLKVALEEAETIKLGGLTHSSYPRKKLEEIISARLGDMFEFIENHLKKIGKNGLLPAGIILTGGGSYINSIEDMARHALHLPSRVASLKIGDGKIQVKDSSWSVAYGLCIMGTIPEEEERLGLHGQNSALTNTFNKIWDWLKQFLP